MMYTKIRQLINETAIKITWFPGILRQSSTWLYFAFSVMLMVGSASFSSAQSTSNLKLPPPPQLKNVTPQSPPPQTIPISVEVTPATAEASKPLKEYTFQAPQTLPAQTPPSVVNTVNTVNTQPLSVPKPTGNPSFYRVEVTGQEPSLLSQVKTIEPMAFIRQSEGVIHAGMFQHSQQAQQRVQQLQKKGVTGTVVPVYQQKKTPLSVQMKP